MRASFQAVQDMFNGMQKGPRSHGDSYSSYLQKALKDKGLEDAIAEARADNKENDIQYMKPGSGQCEILHPPLARVLNTADTSLELLEHELCTTLSVLQGVTAPGSGYSILDSIYPYLRCTVLCLTQSYTSSWALCSLLPLSMLSTCNACAVS